jgi:carboxypeptidase family protein
VRALPKILALALLPRLVAAQGLTTAAIQGTVAGEDAAPIAGAIVRVTNASNGSRWEITTPSTGRYVLEDVPVGGPYRIDVRALGFTPELRAGILLALGQRAIADFALRPAAIELSPLEVTASAHPVLSASRTGPAEVVSASTIATVPNLGRDFFTLTTLSPQAAISPSTRFAQTEGITIGGQNRLLNVFQVDGGVNQDLYTGRWQPGLQTLPRPISLESVDEIQVLPAPFDVRQSGFAGGLVNAVTKSGTNTIHGSVFGFLTDAALTGTNSTGNEVGAFTVWEYGGSVGGPLVRDRAHYFLSVDMYRRAIPDVGPLITDTVGGADTLNVGIRYTSATRFQDILRNTYGLDPGTLGPYEGAAPAADVLGKVTVQLGTNSHLELSHHYTDGERRTFIARQKGTYFLSSVGQHVPATVNTSRAIWTSLLGGRWSNELIGSYLRVSDGCRPNVPYGLINVPADGGTLTAGTGVTCPSSSARNALEVTENLTVGFGAHVFTGGAHAELLRFEANDLLGVAGLWNFRNLDSLAVGHASHYERTFPGPSGGGGIDFRALELGLYVQDRWQPTRPLTLTAGLRLDVPVLPDAVTTSEPLKAALGVDTGRLPSGALLWSPRLGLNYDVGGNGRTFLRGGIGLFGGRPLYAWLASSYWDDDVRQLFLSCDGPEVPVFDPVNQPATCLSGAGVTQRLSFFDPSVRFPQSLKVSLGVDQRLPREWVGTLDVLYTRTEHQLYFSDANLVSPTGVAQGEGDRPLYGTISTTGVATPTRPAPAFGQVVRASNRSGDHAVSMAVELRKQFGDRASVSALYARTRSWDRMSIINNQARPNLETTPLDGTMEGRRLGTSLFEIPDRVDVSAAVRLPYRIQFSLRYVGSSGTPYTYVVRGDANADGIGNGTMRNDIVYVPRDSLDVTLANPGDWGRLNRFIESEPCLREQRGRILARNSCRNPWFGTLNARVTKAVPTVSGQSLELTADVYNLLNMVDRNWGQSRVTTLDPSVNMLSIVGFDARAGRGIYRLQLPGFRQVQDLASRWQMELGVRYVF